MYREYLGSIETVFKREWPIEDGFTLPESERLERERECVARALE